ncbi:sulfite exporter TauE/SafE family protein [Azospirillum doebereinerae]|uniref:Probable membrane transporter protein n=1 Tax=Azospirillum doebereinerae TaxID=92933 RepID=A0A433JD13_9PROT|nr:sulfite exporter TauE/SafE family protein [Azospirillum doebereinerae]MCG5238551.1 sulfite exporter TauE/SafE family protein [Azospirillum doebereinerae]RUQ74624.1 sulfite exporter TauE/SafE family protein [Azospirillum doebereinerae]
MTELLLLAAAFLAGAMNAVAGGGSFLTLPALIYAGVPPVAANATGTVALLPGYASGVYGYRQDLAPVGDLGLPLLASVSLVGGLAGAGLLLVTPDAVFRDIVPWLLLAATGLFAFGGVLAARLRAVGLHGRGALLATLFVVSVYGGYFNGGLGILLLAQLSLFGMTDLNAMNGLKNLFSAVLTAIAVAAYAAGGAVDWPKALLMVLAAVAGGYAGARVGRKIPSPVLRGGIIAVGLTMSALFFLK